MELTFSPGDEIVRRIKNGDKYSVEYQYRPLIMPVLNGLMLKREIIAVQEHERCSFEVTGSLDCDT